MFSIVIPLYNKAKSIALTLQCILAQSFQEFEIIIVDDGSTDNSTSVVKYFSDSRIRLIKKSNGGVCSARNVGILNSNYDFIALLDADDRWDVEYLFEQRKLIEEFPLAAMWGTNFAPFKNNVEEILYTGLSDNFRGYVQNYFGFKHYSDLFCSSSVVIRKSIFEVTGMFDTRIRYSEDLDMWYRIILNFPVVFDARILVHYMQDAENRALERKFRLKDSLLYYVSKYDDYCEQNIVFSRFIHTFCAAHLSKYYFEENAEIKDARVVINSLRYVDIHPKYRLWYKTPYFIGKIIYKLTGLKHKFKI